MIIIKNINFNKYNNKYNNQFDNQFDNQYSINCNGSMSRYINRPNLAKYYNKNIQCIGTYTTDTIVCTGKRVACVENVIHNETNEVLCDHMWIHLNKNMIKQLKFIGRRKRIIITGKVIEYKKGRFTVYPKRLNYVRNDASGNSLFKPAHTDSDRDSDLV